MLLFSSVYFSVPVDVHFGNGFSPFGRTSSGVNHYKTTEQAADHHYVAHANADPGFDLLQRIHPEIFLYGSIKHKKKVDTRKFTYDTNSGISSTVLYLPPQIRYFLSIFEGL